MRSWSYSSLKQFINCPRQYYELRVTERYTQKVNTHMLYGTAVHEALENYAKHHTALPRNYKRYQPAVDALLAIPGEKFIEYPMALGHDKKPVDFESPHRWVRGIVDLMIIDGEEGYIVDYKTGSANYPDPKQLTLMSLMAFQHFERLKNIKAGLLFLASNVFIEDKYNRDDMDVLWNAFTADLLRLDNAFKTDQWPEKPSGLCRFCSVEDCAYNRG